MQDSVGARNSMSPEFVRPLNQEINLHLSNSIYVTPPKKDSNLKSGESDLKRLSPDLFFTPLRIPGSIISDTIEKSKKFPFHSLQKNICSAFNAMPFQTSATGKFKTCK